MRVRRFSGSRPARRATAGALALSLAVVGAAGCGGGGEQQDADEPEGTYQLEAFDVAFPKRQGLGETSSMRMTVRNTGQKTIPDLAVTVDGFNDRQDEPGQADPQRPLWIVNIGPKVYQTAFVNTWDTGPLAPGRERTLSWSVTAVEPGTHTLRWRVQAGLDGRARAVTAQDQPVEGDVTVRVTSRARSSRVDPKTGDVVYAGE